MKVRVATAVHGTLNPYLELVHERHGRDDVEVLALRDQPELRQVDILHVHWPEELLGDSQSVRDRAKRVKWLSWLRLQRRLGAKIVWTAHNLEPHRWMSGPRGWAQVMRQFGAMVDGVVLLTEASREAICSVAPWVADLPTAVIPHPHLRDDVGPLTERAGGQLSRLLFVGRIEPYKRLHDAIHAIDGLTHAQGAGHEVSLTIVGTGADADVHALEELHSGRVRIIRSPLTDAQVGLLANEHDAFLVPQPSFLNSGALFLGLSLHLPTLIRDTPSTRETQATVGTPWVRLFPEMSSAGLAPLLSSGPVGAPDLSAYEPRVVSAAHLDFYERLMGLPH